MLNVIQREQFEKDWDAFIAEQPEGTLYKTLDENGKWSIVPVHQKLRRLTEAYVEKYNAGISSKSAFQIVLDMFVRDGDFKPVVNQESQIPAEIADYIQKAESGKISTFELRRRYMSDKAFRDAYDVHSGLASFASQPVTLTAQEYRSMPIAVIRRRMAEPAFKAAVDALHASGRV
jgi:hypothetical protein